MSLLVFNLQIDSYCRSTVIPWIRRMHLALFYMHGAFYSISRRMAGIRFKSLSPHSDSQVWIPIDQSVVVSMEKYWLLTLFPLSGSQGVPISWLRYRTTMWSERRTGNNCPDERGREVREEEKRREQTVRRRAQTGKGRSWLLSNCKRANCKIED